MNLLLICSVILSPVLIYGQQGNENNKLLIGVFDGRTPCNALASQLNEKVRPECIKIKWRLTLFGSSGEANSGTYEMFGFVYKKDQPRKGNWKITRGAFADPAAIVYELEEPGKPTLLLLKADQNIFFFLDADKKLLVGNRDFSYTLNRINNKLPQL